MPHPVLEIGENLKSISCLCPKLLNFEIDETTNLKFYNIMRKMTLKKRTVFHHIYRCNSTKGKICMKKQTECAKIS